MSPRHLVFVLIACGSADLSISQEKRQEDDEPDQKRRINLEKCLNAIMSAEVNNRNLILIEDELFAYEFNVSIYSLNFTKIIYSENILPKEIDKTHGVLLLLPDTNVTNYENILRASSRGNNLKFVAISESVKAVYHLLERFWDFKILDVVVLYCPSSEAISVFTYRPFSRHGCDTDAPVRIDKWIDDSERFEKGEYLFSKKRKVYDMHGCPVRASVQSEDSRGSTKTMARMIFDLFQDRLNFTGIVVDEEITLADNYFTDYMNLSSLKSLALLQGQADVAVGKFSMLLDQTPRLFAPLQTSMDCYTWAVPVKAGRKPSMWTTYFYEFEILTWAVIGALQLLATGFFYFLCHLSVNRSDPFSKSFDLASSYCFLLGLAIKSKPLKDSLRVFYIAMVLFCFVTNSAYQAAMGSLVTVPPDSQDIKTTEELLSTDLILSGNPRMFHMLRSSNRTSQTVHDVLERFQTINPGEFSKTMYKVFETRRYAVFHRADEFEPFRDELRLTFNVSKPFFLVPNCLFTSFHGPILMKAGSLYAEPFLKIGSALVESGFLKKWKQIADAANEIFFRDVAESDMKFRKYSVEQLKGGLIILLCGYAVSTSMFLLEILSKGFIYKEAAPSNNQMIKSTRKN